MAQKMVFCFMGISAEILLHILSYSVCAEHHILVCFFQMVLPSKASTISVLLCFGKKGW
jgi:hypothetical protein